MAQAIVEGIKNYKNLVEQPAASERADRSK